MPYVTSAKVAREKTINLSVHGKVVGKVSKVRLKRLTDGIVFDVSSACVLRLPGGLVHVVGDPREELDTDIWDVTQKFEVLL